MCPKGSVPQLCRKRFENFTYLIGEEKTGVNFSRVKLLALKRIYHLCKVDHFSLTTFYTLQISQKALCISLKFYFKNRKLINGHVNWFIKINVNVEVFFLFFTTTVSVTNQFWLISHRFDWTNLPYPKPLTQIMV